MSENLVKNIMEAHDRPYLLPVEVGKIMGWHPQWIRIQARNGTLPFPAIVRNRRVQILKADFQRFLDGEKWEKS